MLGKTAGDSPDELARGRAIHDKQMDVLIRLNEKIPTMLTARQMKVWEELTRPRPLQRQ